MARSLSLQESIIKLTDCGRFSAFLHEAKPLKLHRAAIENHRDFGVNPVNLTKPYFYLALAASKATASEAASRVAADPVVAASHAPAMRHQRVIARRGP